MLAVGVDALDRAAGELLGPAVGPEARVRRRELVGDAALEHRAHPVSGVVDGVSLGHRLLRGYEGRAHAGGRLARQSARSSTELVADRDARRGRWPGSAACAAGCLDLVQAHRGEHEAVALVEAQGREVVVGRDQVQARAARRAGGVGQRLDQRAADAAADRRARRA